MIAKEDYASLKLWSVLAFRILFLKLSNGNFQFILNYCINNLSFWRTIYVILGLNLGKKEDQLRRKRSCFFL